MLAGKAWITSEVGIYKWKQESKKTKKKQELDQESDQENKNLTKKASKKIRKKERKHTLEKAWGVQRGLYPNMNLLERGGNISPDL